MVVGKGSEMGALWCAKVQSVLMFRVVVGFDIIWFEWQQSVAGTLFCYVPQRIEARPAERLIFMQLSCRC